jgi:sulfur transfer protein SufE
MSISSLEREIVTELRQITKRRSLRLKDLLEWSTSETKVRENLREGESVVHCPQSGVWCAIRGTGKP